MSPKTVQGLASVPFRFQLDEGSLASALGIAAVQPTEFSNLPAPKAGGQLPATLVQAGITDKNTGALSAEALAALQIAANPARMLAVTSNRAGGQNWVQTAILRGAGGGPCVAHSRHDARYDFEYLPGPAEAIVLLDELMNVTDLPSKEGAKIWMSFYALTALLAASDLLQASELQAKLSRQAQPVPDITAETLGFQLRQGLGSTDTRWAVSSVQPISQVDLGAAAGNLAAGLEELQKAGVVSRNRNAYSFTENGLGLAGSLGNLITSTSIRIAEAGKDGEINFSDFILLRTVASIWLITWLSGDDVNAQVSLGEISASDAIFLFQSLIDPEVPSADARQSSGAQQTSATPRCTGCGRELPPDASFCFICGQPVPGAAKAASAPPLTKPAAPIPQSPAKAPPPAPVQQSAPPPPPRPAAPVAASPAATPPRAQAPPQAPPVASGKCPNCGAAMKPGKVFCMACGTKIG